MTTPTSTPVPSNKPQDLLFNAEALDYFLNSTATTFATRVSGTKLTITGYLVTLDAKVAVVDARRVTALGEIDNQVGLATAYRINAGVDMENEVGLAEAARINAETNINGKVAAVDDQIQDTLNGLNAAAAITATGINRTAAEAAEDGAVAAQGGAVGAFNNAVAAAEAVGSYPTLALATAAVASIPADKGVYVTADGANNGYWVKRSGVLTRESTATLPAVKAALDPIAARVHVGSSRRMPFFVRDSAQRVAIWVNRAGRFCIGSMEDVQGVITTLSGRVNSTLKSISSRSGYAYAIRDTSKRAVFGFTMAGRMMYQGRDVHDLLDPTVLAAIKVQLFPSKNIVSFGDSTTEGAGTGVTGQTITVQLQALYGAAGDTRTVTPFGVSGQKCASINARQGSGPAVVSLPAGASGFPEVPASGAVNITTTADPLANINTSGTRSMAGRLAGVSTLLIKDLATGQYSVQRSTGASAVGVDAAVPFLPDTEAYRFYTYLCWIGTNDILSSTPAQILGYVDQHVGHQATQQKRRVIVMPIINCLSAQLSTILANYAALLALVKAKYPSGECIDTLSLLQRNHNGSADDLADIAAGLPPRSLLSADRYHPGVPGYGVIAAEIKRLFDLKGY